MIVQTEELKAAVLNARAAVLNARIQGMVAENHFRHICGQSPAFAQDSFEVEIANSGVHENNVIELVVHGEL